MLLVERVIRRSRKPLIPRSFSETQEGVGGQVYDTSGVLRDGRRIGWDGIQQLPSSGEGQKYLCEYEGLTPGT